MIWHNICALCNKRRATQFHHQFPQTKDNIETYGKKLIDSDFNKILACEHCNSSHQNIPSWARWTEEKFRAEVLKHGHKLPPGTKEYQQRNKFRGIGDDNDSRDKAEK